MKKLLISRAMLVFTCVAAFAQTENRSSDEEALIESYASQAEEFYDAGDYDNALFYLQKVLSIQEETLGESHPDTAEVYGVIGLVYVDKCDYDNALFYLQKALSIQEETLGENHPDTAVAYNNIGVAYKNKGDYDKALSYFQKALSIREETLGENHPDTAASYGNIGVVYDDKGDYDRALFYQQKALSIRTAVLGEKHPDTAISYNNIGSVYVAKGDYDNALAYYQKALSIWNNMLGEEHPITATSYDNIGYAYFTKGDYDNALSYHQKALSIRERLLGEEHPDIAISYNNIAAVYTSDKDYDNALSYLQKSLSICEKVLWEENPKTAAIYNNIGLVYDYKGDYDNALFYLQKALSIQEETLGENHPDTAGSYYSIGLAYYDKSDYQSAIAYWKKSHRAFSVSSRFVETIDLLSDQLFSAVPDPDFTRETLALAADTVERARLDLSSMRTDIMRRSLPIYYYGVQFEAEQNNPEKSFEYSESLRSRGFLDQLGTETALKLDGVTDEEKNQVRELSAKITSARKTIEAQNNLPISERDESLLASAGAELASAEKSLLTLDEEIGARVPAYSQLRNPKPVSAGEAQEWCGKNRAALEYVMWNPALSENKDAKINSHCIVLTDESVSVVELDGEYDYAAAINRLRRRITNHARESQFEGLRNALYEKLIAPVLPYVPDGTAELVIVPDGNLSFLPFDVLRKDEDSKMLGDEYAVALSPSISVSVLSGKKRAAGQKMLAFGGAWYDTKLSAQEHRENFTEEGIRRGATRGASQVDFEVAVENDAQFNYIKNDVQQNGPKSYFDGIKWGDLPGTIAELNALKANVFAADSFSEIVQEDASERTVKRLSSEGALAQYPMLHFACHGYFDSTIAEMSSVLFSEVSGALKDSSDDGYLTISETAVLKLNADLVCLSACETGLGEMKAGDGMVGLTRAFMVAGARQVGASLWCVDDAATAKFMSSMYEKVVKQGMDYVAAYQQTKAEFRADEKFNHPVYWAAFVLYE